MKKWCNVTADMRLEPGMALLFPETSSRFEAIQDWVFEIESKVRGTTVPSDFLMCLRDMGKGWRNETALKVYEEYSTEARDLVDSLKTEWQQLRPTHTKWEETAHLPVRVAVQIINSLHSLLEDKRKDDGKGKGKGKGKGEGEGEGKGEGKDEGKDEGEGVDDGSGDGEGEENKTPSPKGGRKGISLEDLDNILKGQGEALDPSSAMSERVKENKQNLDHELYIPNGIKPTYRSMWK